MHTKILLLYWAEVVTPQHVHVPAPEMEREDRKQLASFFLRM
jgi:hypothetical protein